MLQRVVFGTTTSEANATIPDLNARELGLVLPLLALMLFMGVYPQPFLKSSRASIEAVRTLLAPHEAARPSIAANEERNK
jgi:NADH-quinone oxidoreductase subunit M